MKHYLIDANVVLDVLLRRDPWVHASGRLWLLIESGGIAGCLPASTFTDLFYVVRRASSLQVAHEAIGLCLKTFEIITVDQEVLERAHELQGSDFEDNVLIACAEISGLHGIVTRDPKGFRHSHFKTWTPAQLIEALGLDTS